MYFELSNFDTASLDVLTEALDSHKGVLLENGQPIPDQLEKMIVEARELLEMRRDQDSWGDELCDGCTI